MIQKVNAVFPVDCQYDKQNRKSNSNYLPQNTKQNINSPEDEFLMVLRKVMKNE